MARYRKRGYNPLNSSKNMITINGRRYSGNGQSVSVINGRVRIDGQDVTPDDNQKEILIHIDGYVNDLSVDVCDTISLNGEAKSLKTQSGDINVVGDVIGNVKTMSGDVKCGNVSGDVNTMSGDIKKRN